jgi:hypothetical protein
LTFGCRDPSSVATYAFLKYKIDNLVTVIKWVFQESITCQENQNLHHCLLARIQALELFGFLDLIYFKETELRFVRANPLLKIMKKEFCFL